MIMPSVSLPEHLDLFEKGIARKIDFSYSGAQSLRMSQLLEDGLLEVGAIHTYIELYSRLYVDLIPNVALVAAYKADQKRQPLYRPQHRRHPGNGRGSRFQERHRHRTGQ